MTNGYLIKFYKQISGIGFQGNDILSQTDFLLWLNFDGMKVYNIEHFIEYETKSISAKSVVADDQTCEKLDANAQRQKLLLFRENDSKKSVMNIFDVESDNMRKLPLISITTINFMENKNVDAKRRIVRLGEILKKYRIVYGINLEFELLGTLSSHDLVLVMRSNKYNAISQALLYLQEQAKKEEFILSKMYTITGIDIKNKENWTEENVKVSLQISVNSCVSPKEIIEVFDAENRKQNIFKTDYVAVICGKYDLYIEGEVLDIKKFPELFINNGIFSADNDSIYHTKTQFLYDTRTEFFENLEFEHTSSNQSDDISREELNNRYNNTIKMLEQMNISKSLEPSIIRLIIRSYQVNKSIFSTGIIGNKFDETLLAFLYLIWHYGQNPSAQEIFAEIVNSLNMLLDNRISVNVPDFETPQSTLRFSGSSARILLAYSNYIDKLVEIVIKSKENSDRCPDYVVYMTADSGAKLTAKVYFPQCKKIRLININIPVNMFYDMKYVIPWITHELGHFVRASWLRCERNVFYMETVLEYLKNSHKIDFGEEMVKYGCDIFKELYEKIKEEGEELSFSKCKEMVRTCLYASYFERNSLVSHCSLDKIQSDKEIIEKICELVQHAFEEAIADVFMISILQIETLEHYLDIVCGYLKLSNVSFDNKLLPFVLRVRLLAICKLIDVNWNTHNRKFTSPDIEKIWESLISYEIDEPINRLVHFLSSKVNSGMQKIMKEDRRICDLQVLLRNNYSFVLNNDFRGCIDFIQAFTKEG